MNREEEIFEAAAALPGEERAAYLDGACAADSELRARIEALLRSHEVTGFMDGATREAGGSESVDQEPGTPSEGSRERIGRYKLLEQIGEGGFGVVWVAEQLEPVRRRVALKIIKPGMDSREVIARFEAERQALAMMDHPNIAKVFDAGTTESGRPFFAMELVRGVRITEFCDQANLPTEERLRLFATVCQAVQHAHQKGIIHRDLKPSNILVTAGDDGQPAPKVIDFGVAKAIGPALTDATVYTRFEQMIGTPAYMSPEQAGLGPMDIDTRSDIYSLGVLLYELLAGRPPFDPKELLDAGLDEMRRVIREVDPPRPSTRLTERLTHGVPALAGARPPKSGTPNIADDLDWIVMKALEKDRTRRYETANGLALDIQRFLADQPVSAGPPGAAYRFRKFATRNKVPLGMTALFTGVLITATAVSLRQARVARTAAAEAMAAKTDATRRAGEERTAREQSESIASFLVHLFRSPDPTRDGREVRVAETLQTAAKRLDTDLATQPLRQARLRGVLGLTFISLGLNSDAVPLFEKSRDYCLRILGPRHPETLTTSHNLAGGYASAGRAREALELRELTLRDRREVIGRDHADTLSAMHNLANSYFDAGRLDEAIRLQEETLGLRREILGEAHPDSLGTATSLANSYEAAGRHDEARTQLEETLKVRRALNGPEHPDTLAVLHNLAISYARAGRETEARQMRDDALRLTRKVNGPEHPDTILAMINMADSFRDAGHLGEALPLIEEALRLSRKVNGPEHRSTLVAMDALAGCYMDADRADEALPLIQSAFESFRKQSGSQHANTLNTMGSLARAYFATGRPGDAVKLQEEVLSRRRDALGLEHAATVETMINLAQFQEQSGRLDESLRLQEETLALSRKVNGSRHTHTLMALNNLANAYGRVGRVNEAIEFGEQTVALRRELRGPDHIDSLKAMHNLANFHDAAGRHDEARKLLEETVASSEKSLGPEHRVTLRARHNLANSYEAAGRAGESLALRERNFDLSRKLHGLRQYETVQAMISLANSYATAGREPEAFALRERALPLSRQVNGANHPDTLTVMEKFAHSLSAAGRQAEADALLQDLAGLEHQDVPARVPQPPQRAAAPAVPTASEGSPAPQSAGGRAVVAPVAEWKWLHPIDGKDPAEEAPGFHQRFFLPEFDDSRWQTGRDTDGPTGGFGYGLRFTGADIGWPEDKSQRFSAYFRHAFTTDRPHRQLELRCQRDDGIIVYLDGKEVVRDNVEPGEEAYRLRAVEAVDEGDDSVVRRYPIAGELSPGPHILAISVHNSSPASTDLRLGAVTLVDMESQETRD